MVPGQRRCVVVCTDSGGGEGMSGKGSARRPGKPGAYECGYERIKWKSKDGTEIILQFKWCEPTQVAKCVLCEKPAVTMVVQILVCEEHEKEYIAEASLYLPDVQREFYRKLQEAARGVTKS
jgi:hypothetical protein